MKHKNKPHIKLYNAVFPPFMLIFLIPTLLIISLIGNFIIDSIVLAIISFYIYKKINLHFYGKKIFGVWSLGFLADTIGNGYLIAVSLLSGATYYEGNNLWRQILSGIYIAVNHSVYDSFGGFSFWGFLFLLSGVIISGVLIFIFDYLFIFNDLSITKKQRIVSSLIFAIITAPYTFLLPKELFL